MEDLPGELSPWGDPAWRDSVLLWVHTRLRELGASQIGDLQPRIRPWSVTGRVLTDRGPVWFKANPPGSRFEPALMEALSRWVPGRVLAPLAIDPDRGWSLLPDGGATLGEKLGASASASASADASAGVRSWDEPLRQYAALQRAVSGRVGELAGLGVPDLRAARLPEQFDALMESAQLRAQVGAADGITAGQYAALGELRPTLAAWCDRLAASVVPPSLDHSDLHDYQVFVSGDGYVFFDWGDASIAHPFTSLLVTLRAVSARYGLAAGSPELDRLREVYLEPWTAERPAAELRADARLAMRLGAIGRAICWQRAFPEAGRQLRNEHGKAVAHWLARLLEPAPD